MHLAHVGLCSMKHVAQNVLIKSYWQALMVHWCVLENVLRLQLERRNGQEKKNQTGHEHCFLFFICCFLMDGYGMWGGIKIQPQRQISRWTRAGQITRQMRKSTQSISAWYHVGFALLWRYMLTAPWQPQQLIDWCLLLCTVQVLLCGILVFLPAILAPS